MSKLDTEKAILVRASTRADIAIAHAMEIINDVNTAIYPHVMQAHALLVQAQTLLSGADQVEPRRTKLTVVIATDTREWDDPAVIFVDTLSPDDFIEDAQIEFANLYMGESDELTHQDFWQEQGAVIKAVMAGHVQIYSAPVGTIADVDAVSVEQAFNHSALRGL